MPRRALTPKGTGFPDFIGQQTIQNPSSSPVNVSLIGTKSVRTGTIPYAGTIGRLRYIGRVGTVELLGTVTYEVRTGTIGQILYIGRQGTLAQLGSVRYLQAGSLGRVTLLGTVGRTTYVGRQGSLAQIGSLRYVQAGSLGRVTLLGTLGRTTYTARTGTVPGVGTVRYVQAGSLGRVTYIPRAGTVGWMGSIRRVGSLARMGAIEESIFSPVTIRTNVPLGPGTTWTGSWQHIGSYGRWAFTILSKGGGGSFAIIGGALGTATAAGTFYGPEQVRGSVLDMFPPVNASQPLRYAYPLFRRTGNSRGTVTVHLTRRV